MMMKNLMSVDNLDDLVRPVGQRTPLKQPDWHYVEQYSLEQMTCDDWQFLDDQRAIYMATEKPKQALDMLLAQRGAPSFGYQISNFEHCLQAATMAMNDGQDEETIVVALFHDIGFTVCNETHGDFAAELLRPYVDDRHIWTLRRHMYFQYKHCPGINDIDYDFCDRWRGHDNYAWAEEFVRRYDIEAINANYQNAPLSEFIPLVESVFGRVPKTFEPED